ncbi:MAG: hypothetical protein GY862_09590 [Gammaproteobacteria bacterium]|nr:hypothetical protein [Gammaproteobacteria bacterium]
MKSKASAPRFIAMGDFSTPVARIPEPAVTSEPDTKKLGNEPKPAAEEVKIPAPDAKKCYKAGPYFSKNRAKKARKWLRRRQLQVRLASGKKRVESSWWVYLPPFKTRKAARLADWHLSRRGIRDHRVVTRKKFRNAISLGLYKKKNSTKRRLSELRSKGYHSAEVQTRYKKRSVYWLTIEASKDSKNVSKSFQKVFRKPALEKMACKNLP